MERILWAASQAELSACAIIDACQSCIFACFSGCSSQKKKKKKRKEKRKKKKLEPIEKGPTIILRLPKIKKTARLRLDRECHLAVENSSIKDMF